MQQLKSISAFLLLSLLLGCQLSQPQVVSSALPSVPVLPAPQASPTSALLPIPQSASSPPALPSIRREPSPYFPKPFPLPSSALAMVEASNQFGFKAYQVLARENKSQNVVFSPIGLSILIAYLYAQSTPEQQQALAGVMGWQAFSQEQIGNYLKLLIEKLSFQDPLFLKMRSVHMLCYRALDLPPTTPLFRELGFGFSLFPLGGNASDCQNSLNKIMQEDGPFQPVEAPLRQNDIFAQAFRIAVKWLPNNLYKNPDPPHNIYGIDRNKFQLPDKTLIKHPIVGVVGAADWSPFMDSGVQAVRIDSEDKLYQYTFFKTYITGPFPSAETLENGVTFVNWKAFQIRKRLEDLIVAFPRFKAQHEVNLTELLDKILPQPLHSEHNQLLAKSFVDVSQDAFAKGVLSEDADLVPFYESNLKDISVTNPFTLVVTDKETGLILLIAAIRNPAQDPL
jgi:hypothetical protein